MRLSYLIPGRIPRRVPGLLGPAAAFCLALAGCLFQEDEASAPSLTNATLAETGLIGTYDMVDFRVEFSDGTVIDTSRMKLTGLIQVSADSGYIQRIWINETSTDTQGRIIGIRARADDRSRGAVSLTLAGSATPGESDFEIRGDTLIWTTEVEPGQAGRQTGFKETGRYLRTL